MICERCKGEGGESSRAIVLIASDLERLRGTASHAQDRAKDHMKALFARHAMADVLRSATAKPATAPAKKKKNVLTAKGPAFLKMMKNQS